MIGSGIQTWPLPLRQMARLPAWVHPQRYTLSRGRAEVDDMLAAPAWREMPRGLGFFGRIRVQALTISLEGNITRR
jgi:hypothetical protein